MREGDHPALAPGFFGRNRLLGLPRVLPKLGDSETLHRLYRFSDALKGRTEFDNNLYNIGGGSIYRLPFDTIPSELEHGRFHFLAVLEIARKAGKRGQLPE